MRSLRGRWEAASARARRCLGWAAVGLAGALFIWLASGNAARAAPALQEPPPATPATSAPAGLPSARRGQAIYQENCAPCHGQTGMGNGPAASGLQFTPTQFADPATARQASLAAWFDVTRNGRMARMMPPWSNRLTDAEIWDAVAYAWTLHLDPGELDVGRRVYESACLACHGAQGRGDGPQAPPNTPNLAAPLTYERTLAQWFDVISAGRGAMPAFADQLSEDERWAVAEYARSFAYQPLTALAFEPGPGVITGTLTNATAGGGATSGLTVTLRVFDSATFDEVRSLETTTGDDGSFRFEGLPTAADWAYLTAADYLGVPYAAGPATFPTDTITLTLPIEVYETTTDGSGIRIERAHWFIEFDAQALLVGELYIIGQAGDRVYIGDEEAAPGRRVTLRFPLPTGYQELSVEGEVLGQRFLELDGALVDTLPVPPGQAVRQVLLRYRYPFSGRQLDFKHRLAYPVTTLNVLASDIGVEISSPQVTLRDRQGSPDQQYLNFIGQQIPAGQEVVLSLRNLPTAGRSSAAAASSFDPALVVAVLVVVLLGLAGGVGYPIWRSRRQAQAEAPAAASAEDDVEELEVERQRLLLAIARLDDEHDAGRLPDDVYARERAQRKARLLEITRRLSEADRP